ncbi:MAG: YdeI/OmpD-associated family protein, partial [Chloroflexi bacterium]|nr:YdeI/OmpD-associated family protein [Chloroflexota bacterium]
MERARRPRYEMPEFMWRALVEQGLDGAYRNRPSYQQNDYIGWITRAKREETRDCRVSALIGHFGTREIGVKELLV